MKKLLLIPLLLSGLFGMYCNGQSSVNPQQIAAIVDAGITGFLPKEIDKTFTKSQNQTKTYAGWQVISDSISQILLPSMQGQTPSLTSIQDWLKWLQKQNLPPAEILGAQTIVNTCLGLIPVNVFNTWMTSTTAGTEIQQFVINVFGVVQNTINNELENYAPTPNPSPTPTPIPTPSPSVDPTPTPDPTAGVHHHH